jgi:hypothetical protein
LLWQPWRVVAPAQPAATTLPLTIRSIDAAS